jgi:hypothetical protein
MFVIARFLHLAADTASTIKLVFYEYSSLMTAQKPMQDARWMLQVTQAGQLQVNTPSQI